MLFLFNCFLEIAFVVTMCRNYNIICSELALYSILCCISLMHLVMLLKHLKILILETIFKLTHRIFFVTPRFFREIRELRKKANPCVAFYFESSVFLHSTCSSRPVENSILSINISLIFLTW